MEPAPEPAPRLRSEDRGAGEIALGYAVAAGLWILLSDQAVEMLVGELSTATAFQTLKGLFFVLATTAGLFLFIRRYLRRLAATEKRLDTLNRELEDTVELRTQNLERTVEELESFSYTVSHDLRAPLRAIDGFAEMLQVDHGSRLGEEGRRLTTVIQKNCLEMTELIDGLLLYSRLGRRPLVKASILLRSVFEKHAVAADLPQDQLELELGEMLRVSADAEMLDILVGEILSNSFKFHEGTTARRVRVRASVAGQFARVAVQDSGVGFDMRHGERVFKLFDKAHQPGRFPGSGVGLAVAHRIVMRHGGQLAIQSSPDRGTTVTFTLPLADG